MLLLTITFVACSPAMDPSPGADAPTASLETSAALPPSPTVVANGVPAATASRLTLADAKDCPVSSPGTAPADIGDRLFGSTAAFGNDALWVGGLGEDGVILADQTFVESDASIAWKLGWWRILPGRLTITGRRLDAPSPPLRASVPDGYGSHGFQAGGVSFPAEGCWEVTGSVGDAELTFVTFVLRT